MKIKFGALVVDGRGKIGGQVASKNRAGAYLRNKVTPTNPQTPDQLAVRATLASLSSRWRDLTEAQRVGWNSAVEEFTTTDIFGDTVVPSGKNLFTRLNAVLVAIGASEIDDAPSAVAIIEPTLVIQTNAAGTPALSLTVGNLDGDQTYQILATAPLSAGKFFVKSEYRQIAAMDGGESQPFDILSVYVAKFGALIAGKKVFIKAIPANSAMGQKGVGASASSITSA